MTKAGAIHGFWESFGLTAYEENAVPSGDEAPDFPYITYELITDGFGAEVALSGSLWYRGTSWVDANAKADEISETLGYAGVMLDCDSGRILLRCGSPFAQSMGDADDDMIRRKLLNITAMFLTSE